MKTLYVLITVALMSCTYVSPHVTSLDNCLGQPERTMKLRYGIPDQCIDDADIGKVCYYTHDSYWGVIKFFINKDGIVYHYAAER